MQIDEAEERLRQTFIEAGNDIDAQGFLVWWEAFKRFATEPVDSPSDGLLFQSGVYTFTGVDQFTVGFVRQFDVTDDDGDHEHYVQLQCEFLYDPTDEMRAFGSFNLWCFPSDGDSMLDWFEQVEGRREFQTAAQAIPGSFTIWQEAV